MGLHLRPIAGFEQYGRCGTAAYVRPCAKKNENRFATMKFRVGVSDRIGATAEGVGEQAGHVVFVGNVSVVRQLGGDDMAQVVEEIGGDLRA